MTNNSTLLGIILRNLINEISITSAIDVANY